MELKRLPALFYRTTSGREPVREWLKSLDERDRRIIGQDIARAEYGWPVSMPVCRSLARSLFEIRSDIGQGRTARVIFCIADGGMVLLHGFIKKTPKTPRPDIDLALRRKRKLLP